MKEIFRKTFDKIQVSQEYVVNKYKYYLRKLAIRNIREKIQDLQKKETDFTKEEMRKLIEKEEKRILKDMGVTVSLATLASLFGISTFR